MQLIALITNQGKHSNEKLAIATAGDIVQIGASAAGEQAIDGRKLENKIIEVLEKHFGDLADVEHQGIAANGVAHLASSLDPHPEIHASAVDEVMAAIKASPISKWFDIGDAEKNVRFQVAKRMKEAQHMHRDWFARSGKIGHGVDLKDADNHDRDSEHVKRWIDMHQGDAAAHRQAVHEHAAALAGA